MISNKMMSDLCRTDRAFTTFKASLQSALDLALSLSIKRLDKLVVVMFDPKVPSFIIESLNKNDPKVSILMNDPHSMDLICIAEMAAGNEILRQHFGTDWIFLINQIEQIIQDI